MKIEHYTELFIIELCPMQFASLSLGGPAGVPLSLDARVLQTSQNRNNKNFGETDRVLDVVSACPDAGRDDRQSRVVRCQWWQPLHCNKNLISNQIRVK